MKFKIRGSSLAWCLLTATAVSGAEPVREIPDARWVDIFFASIDRLTAAANVTPLREIAPSADHLEARFWFGFGLGGEQGVIVRRDATGWSGMLLDEDLRSRTVQTKPVYPRSNWESAWDALEGARLLTLPDFRTLPQSGYIVSDGSCGVVEVFAAGAYRTYMYPNSWHFDNPECLDFEALVSVLRREFLGEDEKPPLRIFLSATEIATLRKAVGSFDYPLQKKAFLKGLPLDLIERGLGSNGASGEGGIWTTEWPLTSRIDPKGYYVLVGYLEGDPMFDREKSESLRGAEVRFRDRVRFSAERSSSN
jgi:hypothetical protein